MRFILTINRFVLVEFGSSQKSPARSPTRTYIPLQVSSPQVGTSTSFIAPTASSPVKFDEGIERVIVDHHNVSSSPGQLMILDSDELSKEKELDVEDDPSVCEVTPLMPDLSLAEIRDATIKSPLTDPVVPAVAVTTSPRFSSFLLRPEEISSGAETPKMFTPDVSMDVNEASEPPMPPVTQEAPPEDPPSTTRNLVITRQEVFALTSVLGRLPQSMISQPGPSSSGDITFNIVDDPPQSPTRNLTQQSRDQGTTQELEKPNAYSSCEETQVTRGKRQRPKYSLKTHMLRKHPVLMFFATGPMERSKTPYKWWCRVCRVELSLMSCGVLELLSHFKTDAHLIKEHRIRLETPGLPLVD